MGHISGTELPTHLIIPRGGYCFEVSVSVDPWIRGSVGPSALNLRKQRLLKAETYFAVGPLSKCVQRLVIIQIGQKMYFWRIFEAP